MLTRIDRLQLAVPDRKSASEGWVALLGAEAAGDDRVACLAARRSRYRLGDGCIELLEPDGAGPLQEAVGRRGGHLFAAGAATADLDALVARLRSVGAPPTVENEQAYLGADATGIGLRVVLSGDETLEPVGDVAFLYETTLLAADAPAAVDRCVELFALDASAFVPIDSKHYGYAGTLTLFHPDRLGRFEVIAPNEPQKTMGRFFARFGASLYMAFAESAELAAIEERTQERRAGMTAEPPAERREGRSADTLFLHPSALGGMMLGISRPTQAWQWSGHPERVEPAR